VCDTLIFNEKNSVPIRFCCQFCKLPIKIGEPMAGRTVRCPQCGKPIVVPRSTEQQAQELYQTQVATAKSRVVPPPLPNAAGQPMAAKPSKTADTESNLDDWIDQFWTSIPEEESTVKPPLAPPFPSPQNVSESATNALRQKQTLVLFRIWLAIIFIIGFVFGFAFRSFFLGKTNNTQDPSGVTVNSAPALTDSVITGKLYYRGVGREKLPDADAVILFIPKDKTPAVSMSVKGLRPDDNAGAGGEGVQQIEEMQGLFCRAGANGEFSIPYKRSGKYLAIFISAQLTRPDESEGLDRETLKTLKLYFKRPQDLVGNYTYISEEYEFTSGTYNLRLMFQ
jgi:hypothetical protein